jgi:two-component system, probable response regulator PhcQ
MNGYFDYKKFAILYVDDEEKSLKMFSQAFERTFRILTAPSAAEGFRLLEQHHDEIGLLMTDQRMPGEKGVQLLERARQAHPRIIRILTTAYADIEAAISAVNTGSIYRYVTKPWEAAELEQVLRRGLEFFQVQHERDQLLREKLSSFHNMMVADRVIGLGILAAGLSHHIRNSLVAVRTFMDLAPSKLEEEQVKLDELRNPNYWRGFYDQVQTQIRRITDLLGDLGLASEQLPCEFNDPVQLQTLLAQALDRARERIEAKQIKVRSTFEPSLPELRADANKLRRLLDLLIEDELATLPNGSEIKMNVRTLPASREEQTRVLLEIQDDGPGLSTEALRSVFDPFFIRGDDPQEFGINLMACYFIVHHHGGQIQVTSEEKEGTTFRVTLPVLPQAQPSPLAEQDFMSKVLLNEGLWEKLLAGKDEK